MLRYATTHFLLTCLTTIIAFGQVTFRELLPSPAAYTTTQGLCNVPASITIQPTSTEARDAARLLQYYIEKGSLCGAPISNSSESFVVCMFTNENNDSNKESYQVDITANRIWIKSKTAEGLKNGALTVAQLLQKAILAGQPIECGTIHDTPRFAWRGIHLDVSRHFFDVDFIKKYLDMLALAKINIFHWHLTDDNG